MNKKFGAVWYRIHGLLFLNTSQINDSIQIIP